MHKALYSYLLSLAVMKLVSVITGHTKYYPIYSLIGNIHNNVQHVHQNNVVLLNFLAISKSKLTFSIGLIY